MLAGVYSDVSAPLRMHLHHTHLIPSMFDVLLLSTDFNCFVYVNVLCTLFVVKGYAAGPHRHRGGGSNLVCLPNNPQWKNHMNGTQTAGEIFGIEYELTYVFSNRNNGGNALGSNPASCSFCYVGGRSTVAMIPARTQCPDGWTTQYAGYLVSDVGSRGARSSYVCWDEAPEIAVGGVNENNGVICPVEVLCGTLPCSLYPTGKELTCIVCSK